MTLKDELLKQQKVGLAVKAASEEAKKAVALRDLPPVLAKIETQLKGAANLGLGTSHIECDDPVLRELIIDALRKQGLLVVGNSKRFQVIWDNQDKVSNSI